MNISVVVALHLSCLLISISGVIIPPPSHPTDVLYASFVLDEIAAPCKTR